jgi:hypothetical protein
MCCKVFEMCCEDFFVCLKVAPLSIGVRIMIFLKKNFGLIFSNKGGPDVKKSKNFIFGMECPYFLKSCTHITFTHITYITLLILHINTARFPLDVLMMKNWGLSTLR